MSRKAKVLSLSKSFMEGISPSHRSLVKPKSAERKTFTLDYFAEYAGCHFEGILLKYCNSKLGGVPRGCGVLDIAGMLAPVIFSNE